MGSNQRSPFFLEAKRQVFDRSPEELEPEEELQQFRALRAQPTPELRERLVLRYKHLVLSVVRKFRQAGDWEDLMQIGYVGLLKAVNNFDPVRGNRFSTYAVHCIGGELRHHQRDNASLIRRPRWLTTWSRQAAAFIEKHLSDLQRLPTIAEIARALNLSEANIMDVLRFKAPISLDTPSEELELARMHSLRYEELQLPIEDRIFVLEALEALMELERRVVYMFFYADLNQSEIAGRFNLAPRKVSRLMAKALEKLREVLHEFRPEFEGPVS